MKMNKSPVNEPVPVVLLEKMRFYQEYPGKFCDPQSYSFPDQNPREEHDHNRIGSHNKAALMLLVSEDPEEE